MAADETQVYTVNYQRDKVIINDSIFQIGYRERERYYLNVKDVDRDLELMSFYKEQRTTRINILNDRLYNDDPFLIVRFNSDLDNGFLNQRRLYDVVDALIILGAMWAVLHFVFAAIVWFFYRSQADTSLIELFNEEDAIAYKGNHLEEVEKKMLHIKTSNF